MIAFTVKENGSKVYRQRLNHDIVYSFGNMKDYSYYSNHINYLLRLAVDANLEHINYVLSVTQTDASLVLMIGNSDIGKAKDFEAMLLGCPFMDISYIFINNNQIYIFDNYLCN